MKKKKIDISSTISNEELDNMKTEEILERIDKIILKLQQEDISVEENMLFYEQGMKLVKKADSNIEKIRHAIKILEEDE